MQKRGLKILIIALLAYFPLVAFSQFNTNLLAKADSLFQQKRYTQSFEIYKTLFENGQYSPAMLLKMAYIQEGLNHISQSAYYVNLYYLATQDEAAEAKLEEMATKYGLEGYTSDQFDRAIALYQKYHQPVSIAFASIIVFLMTLSLVQRLRFHSKPYAAWGVLITVSIIFAVHLNFGVQRPKAIIVNNNTYLMDAPSAGASVVSIVRDGHRVQVLGKKDVWLRVSWGESEAYVKESSIIPVKL